MAAKKGERGRPTILTPDLQKRIANLIRTGLYPSVAAQICGVSGRVFFDWMQRARGEHPTRDSTPALRAFADEVEIAIAQSEGWHQGQVHKFIAGDKSVSMGQARLALEVLSRRWPERHALRPQQPAQLPPSEPEPTPAEDEPPPFEVEVVFTAEDRNGEVIANADSFEELHDEVTAVGRRLSPKPTHPCPEELADDAAATSRATARAPMSANEIYQQYSDGKTQRLRRDK